MEKLTFQIENNNTFLKAKGHPVNVDGKIVPFFDVPTCKHILRAVCMSPTFTDYLYIENGEVLHRFDGDVFNVTCMKFDGVKCFALGFGVWDEWRLVYPT